MTMLLTDSGDHEVVASDGLWMSAEDAARATGWELKPEGMCRDDQCVPLPPKATRAGAIDLQAFWKKLGAPIVHDEKRQAWSLGTAADDRNAALAGLAAPDFTLKDLAGKERTLSQLRGKKILLSTWASW